MVGKCREEAWWWEKADDGRGKERDVVVGEGRRRDLMVGGGRGRGG